MSHERCRLSLGKRTLVFEGGDELTYVTLCENGYDSVINLGAEMWIALVAGLLRSLVALTNLPRKTESVLAIRLAVKHGSVQLTPIDDEYTTVRVFIENAVIYTCVLSSKELSVWRETIEQSL